MKQRKLYTFLIVLNLLIISMFLVQYTNAAYPLVGHDFRLYIPRLIDSHLYYKVNGFGIEWYTPSFGGGLPAYPNPLQMQFSLQQLLTWFFNPWLAILIAIIIFTIIGFLVMYFLLKDCLEYQPLPAILGAVFFVANGFFIEHIVVGHVNFITFPLIVIPVFALTNPKLPGWLAGALIALTGAILVNSGGVYIGVICVFTLCLTLPLIHFLKPELLTWHKVVPVALWGSILTIFLCGSKIYAINALMESFPRVVHDHYFVAWFTSIAGIIGQLVGTMTALPLLKLLGKSSLDFVVRLTKWTGSPYGYWELDTSISPVLIVLLVWGVGKKLLQKPALDKKGLLKKILAGVILVFSMVLVVQFTTARGFLFDHLSGLPLLRSTRTNSRFSAAFILPCVLLGIKVFNDLSKRISTRNNLIVFIIMNTISVLALGSYYLLPLKVQERFYDTRSMLETYYQIQSGQVFPVNKIIPAMNDYEVFQAQASNTINHYDPLYGETSFYPQVHEGSVFDIDNGYYNMSDPSGYVFPSENNSKLFSRIPVSDYKKLVDFINRRPSDWKLPFVQILLDWTAGITFLLLICAILIYLAGRWISFPKLRPFQPFRTRNHP